MAREFAKAFYKSSSWVKTRNAYMTKEIHTPFGTVPSGMCERCFSMGRLVPAVVVHHKVALEPWNINDVNISLSYDNLQRLCTDCHALVHSSHPDGFVSRAIFDEQGNVVGTRT